MSMIYLYDGTFEGLATAVYEAYYSKQRPSAIISQEDHSPTFFDEEFQIYTDQIKANKVLGAIREKLGEDVLQRILYAFFSEDPNAGTIIYKFIRVAFKMGPKVIDYRAHEDVGPMLDLYRKVARESHSLLGLIRFVELDNGILYSQFEGTYNVLSILGSHFFGRLSGEQWILHDLKRSYAVFCNGKEWVMREADIPQEVPLHKKELLFQKLWKTYFKHIAIKERSNPALQQNFMPKKYWKYLIEMNDNTNMNTFKKLN